MKIVTMQSFDDNIMQMTEKERQDWNNVRMKEWNDIEQAKALKRHEDWFAEYSKACYSQSTITSLLQALKLAEMDLFEAADKFCISYYNYPSRVKFDINEPMHKNREWENREMLLACSERANNASNAIHQLIRSIEHPVIEKG